MNILKLLDVAKRAIALNGFWSRRTTFYRDLASALQARELPKDFISGELTIALSPMTQDKNRARGLSYIQNIMHASDMPVQDALMRSMPKNDSLALGTLKFAKSIPSALRELADNVDGQSAMTKMIRQALISPMLLLPVGYVFAYVLSSVSIPEFAKAAPPEVWTSFNAFVRDTAYAFRDYGHWLALAIVLALVWIFAWALANLTSRWRYVMESSRGYKRALWVLVFPFQPIFALYRDIQGTRMLGNLANLMQSGMLLKDALRTLAEGAQPWMRKHLAMVHEHLDIAAGDYVGAFSHGVLPTFILGRMGSMVRRDTEGQFDQVLIKLGTVGMQEATASVQASAVKINAILLAVAMFVIVFFYGGQNSIAYAIQDANSPTAVMRRQLERAQNKNIAPAAPAAPSPTK